MKCFYHNDLDGRCAGSIVARFEGDYNKNNFFEVDYLMPLPLDAIQKGEVVYFVDYSFSNKTIWQLEKVLEKTQNVIWIDHHTSSLNLENEVTWLKDIKGIRKDKISGAGLTYMYLYDKESIEKCPIYIQLVSDYDCWIYKFEELTNHFKIGIETQQFDALDDIWGCLEYDKIGKPCLKDITTKGELIKGYIDNDNTYYREHFAYETEIEGLRCLVVNKKSNSWIFGEKYNDYPIVMVWAYNGDRYTYSIFSSNKDVDCSKIAEKIGGGGHKGAAGFSSTELLFKKCN